MCVIDSDYTDEGGSGNPQGTGFLSISMSFILLKNNSDSVCLDCKFKINLIGLSLTMKPHICNNTTEEIKREITDKVV